MRAVDIILKKRNNIELTKEEIDFFIQGYVDGTIEDYQASAFTMAVYFNGMTDSEIVNLTLAMLNSGDKIDLSMLDGIKVDKHSTGGVGDKTSLVVGPIVASLGIKLAKMSGRGLGHTGGTLDKLESIPGYDINISDKDFIDQVKKINIALVGQTLKLVPADKKLYALRDVTATVDSIPLIASSIMSKKLASGADVISLDVKVGSGAFMKDIESATKLANIMVMIGNSCGKKTTATLTNMDEPLGYAVGNALEVIEAIDTLNGNGPEDFKELCLVLAAHLVLDSNMANTLDEAITLCQRQIDNKQALNKFAELVEAQHGDKSYIYNPDKFELASNVIEVISEKEGYISRIDALMIGNAAMYLGAGRQKKSDPIDPAVGIVLTKKVGSFVKKGETIAKLYSRKKDNPIEYKMTLDAFEVSSDYKRPQLILKIVK